MEFRTFADRAAEIEATEADLETVALVADLLADAGEDLAVVARFVQGRVFPAWSSRTLDVGPALCYEAMARAAGPNVDVDDVEDRLADLGDVGEVAASLDLGGQAGLGAFAAGEDGPGSGEDARGGGRRTVGEVYDVLDDLAAAAGGGSRGRKLDLLFGLFSDASSEEARYLARLVLGEMRIGVGEGTVRDAIAEAFDVPVEAVGRALQVTNDYGLVPQRAQGGGEEGLSELTLEVGRPVQAMLAQAGTVSDALEGWGRAVVETKLDGARVQVHYGRDMAAIGGVDGDAGGGRSDEPDVRLFSRNMEDVTDALPEVVEFVEANVAAPSILDGEVVAVDDDGQHLPFQEILRRFRRKHDVEAAREDVGAELHLFDCLHAPADVADELQEGAIERTSGRDEPGPTDDDRSSQEPGQAGLSAFAGGSEAAASSCGSDSGAGSDTGAEPGASTEPGAASRSAPDAASRPSPESDDLAAHAGGVDLLDVPLRQRRAFLEATVEAGVVEAVVTDDPDEVETREQAALEAGHEGIMLKNPASTYTPGRRGRDWLKRKPDVETLDLVVTGAEWGEGRRAELFGTFEVSARTEDGFAVVGNVATGVTDEELAELHELLEPHVESETGQEVELEPAVVFEVGYEEIQRSPTYESGYALRFPRFVAVREDLDPGDADELARVERLAEEQ